MRRRRSAPGPGRRQVDGGQHRAQQPQQSAAELPRRRPHGLRRRARTELRIEHVVPAPARPWSRATRRAGSCWGAKPEFAGGGGERGGHPAVGAQPAAAERLHPGQVADEARGDRSLHPARVRVRTRRSASVEQQQQQGVHGSEQEVALGHGQLVHRLRLDELAVDVHRERLAVDVDPGQRVVLRQVGLRQPGDVLRRDERALAVPPLRPAPPRARPGRRSAVPGWPAACRTRRTSAGAAAAAASGSRRWHRPCSPRRSRRP